MDYIHKNAVSGRWIWIAHRVLVTVIAMLMTGCAAATAPAVPSHVTVTPTAFSWQTLEQRPLHLPSLKPGALCPTTHGQIVHPSFGFALGNGPVYAVFGSGSPHENEYGILRYADAQSFTRGTGQWGGQKLMWIIRPTYRGPALIRGSQLDSSGMIRFTNDPTSFSDQTLLSELRLPADLGGAPWPNGGAYIRLQVPGCYASQVDGLGFSYVIIFKAVAIHIAIQKP